VQAPQLYDNKKQEEAAGKTSDKEILPLLPDTLAA
jgi:hypothetical protein